MGANKQQHLHNGGKLLLVGGGRLACVQDLGAREACPIAGHTSMRSGAPSCSEARKRTAGLSRRLSTATRTPAAASAARTRSASSASPCLLQLRVRTGVMTTCPWEGKQREQVSLPGERWEMSMHYCC